MTWIYQLAKAILDSLIGYLTTRPQPTITDAKTPKDVLIRWRNYVASRLPPSSDSSDR